TVVCPISLHDALPIYTGAVLRRRDVSRVVRPVAHALLDEEPRPARAGDPMTVAGNESEDRAGERGCVGAAIEHDGDFLDRLLREDRKSTRLNSSHVKI